MRMKRSYTLVALVGILLGGCGIPPSMHVREGGQPRYQDEDVLFRATYYFRVFDFCDGSLGGDHAAQRIKNDSLYRFRMTGKGKSSFSKVRFESGSLQAWQIDPLGASVEFDKDSKPYFVSQQKREEQLRQSRLYAEVTTLPEQKEAPQPRVSIPGTN